MAPRRSKEVHQRELNGSRSSRRVGSAKEWRAPHANDAGDVGVVENIESIHAEFQSASLARFAHTDQTRNREGLRQSQVNLRRRGPASCVPGDAGRPVVPDGVAVVVESGRNVKRRPTGR